MATADIKKIGVLTGGGDCPGLNPAIKAIVVKAHDCGVDVIGIQDGWMGLVSDGPYMHRELGLDIVRTIDRSGGTILGTSRTNPFNMEGGPDAVVGKFKALGLDALIAIGGEDTLGVADRLCNEHGLNVVGVPKTIDRDLSATQYTLGFETAVQVIMQAIDDLRTTAGSHRRIFVVETMGRHAGHLALKGGIAGSADIILIPEVPFEMDGVCRILADRHSAGHRYSIVVVSEGASLKDGSEELQSQELDDFGHVKLGGIGQSLAREIQEHINLETRHVILSHLQRGGSPVAYDRRMGYYFGTAAAEAVMAGKFGTMPSLKEGRVRLVTLKEAVSKLRTVDVRLDYDIENYRHSHRLLVS